MSSRRHRDRCVQDIRGWLDKFETSGVRADMEMVHHWVGMWFSLDNRMQREEEDDEEAGPQSPPTG